MQTKKLLAVFLIVMTVTSNAALAQTPPSTSSSSTTPSSAPATSLSGGDIAKVLSHPYALFIVFVATVFVIGYAVSRCRKTISTTTGTPPVSTTTTEWEKPDSISVALVIATGIGFLMLGPSWWYGWPTELKMITLLLFGVNVVISVGIGVYYLGVVIYRIDTVQEVVAVLSFVLGGLLVFAVSYYIWGRTAEVDQLERTALMASQRKQIEQDAKLAEVTTKLLTVDGYENYHFDGDAKDGKLDTGKVIVSRGDVSASMQFVAAREGILFGDGLAEFIGSTAEGDLIQYNPTTKVWVVRNLNRLSGVPHDTVVTFALTADTAKLEVVVPHVMAKGEDNTVTFDPSGRDCGDHRLFETKTVVEVKGTVGKKFTVIVPNARYVKILEGATVSN